MGTDRAEVLQKLEKQERWFLSHMEGNSLIPQTSLGINIFFLDSLLQGPLTLKALDEFEHFVPSLEMTQKAEQVMTSFHEMHGISSERTQQFIDEKRVVREFSLTVEMSLKSLYEALDVLSGSKDQTWKQTDGGYTGEDVWRWLNTHTESTAPITLKKLLGCAKNVIRSEANGLCKEYKEWIRQEQKRILDKKRDRGKIDALPITLRVSRLPNPLDQIKEKILAKWKMEMTDIADDVLKLVLKKLDLM